MDDAARSALPQPSRQLLSGGVGRGVMDQRHLRHASADVVKVGPQIGKTDAHVEMQWRLAGGLHETHAMVSRAGMGAAMDAKIRFRV
jgi:hypothetical protein